MGIATGIDLEALIAAGHLRERSLRRQLAPRWPTAKFAASPRLPITSRAAAFSNSTTVSTARRGASRCHAVHARCTQARFGRRQHGAGPLQLEPVARRIELRQLPQQFLRTVEAEGAGTIGGHGLAGAVQHVQHAHAAPPNCRDAQAARSTMLSA